MWLELGKIAALLLVSHFAVMWHWGHKYKNALGSAIASLEVQSYKTVNEVRAEIGLDPLTPSQGGNMVLSRALIESMIKRNS